MSQDIFFCFYNYDKQIYLLGAVLKIKKVRIGQVICVNYSLLLW